jgi:alkaline phosphatase D
VAQQLLIAELEHLPYEDERYWNDAWDGYPLARRRRLAEVVRTRLENPVFLTGDWHSTFVNDLKLAFKLMGRTTRRWCPTTRTSSTTEGDRRGYFNATIAADLMELDLRLMTSVEDPDGTGYTERSFVVENGVPGARPA